MIIDRAGKQIGLYAAEAESIMFATGLECCGYHERALFEAVLPSAGRIAKSIAENKEGFSIEQRISIYRFAASKDIANLPNRHEIAQADMWPNLPHGALGNPKKIERHIPLEAAPSLLSLLGGLVIYSGYDEEKTAAHNAITYMVPYITNIEELTYDFTPSALVPITQPLN